MNGPVDLGIGSVFGGDFRVVRKLSEGGMGSVWIAEQLSTGKERALKVMHAQMVADARLRERFAQEARVGARIDSDHVVEVVAAGIEATTGSPWLAMELLRGETLSDRLARGPIDRATSREVFSQLSHALAAAHDAHIVHRDLKPDNLFLAHPRRSGVPFTLKVLDFGIAKLMLESHTKHTASIGTPMWMAPEQTETGKSITPACDVWALGLIAYNVLTGRFFWHSVNNEGSGPLQLMREVLMDPIDPASTRAAHYGIAHLLPSGFDAWFDRCLARPIEHRFQHARAALAALDRLLADGTVAHTQPVQPQLQTTPQTSQAQRTMEMARPSGTQLAPPPTVIAQTTGGVAPAISMTQLAPASTPKRASPAIVPIAATIAALAIGIGAFVAFRWRDATPKPSVGASDSSPTSNSISPAPEPPSASASIAAPSATPKKPETTNAGLAELQSVATCEQKKAVLEKFRDDWDPRALAAITPLQVLRGCGGFFKNQDCWPCLHKDGYLDKLVHEIELRPNPGGATTVLPKSAAAAVATTSTIAAPTTAKPTAPLPQQATPPPGDPTVKKPSDDPYD